MVADFLFSFYSFAGLVTIGATDGGFCSAPSILDRETSSKPMYWKVTNPTLSPSHLQGIYHCSLRVYSFLLNMFPLLFLNEYVLLWYGQKGKTFHFY